MFGVTVIGFKDVSNHWTGIWTGMVEWKMEWNSHCTRRRLTCVSGTVQSRSS